MPPPPRRARRTPVRTGGPGGGRHRRPKPPSRPVLLAVFAVLALLLGSGTAISLTAAPAPPQAGGPEVAALGAAPVTTSPAAPADPTRTPADPPSPEPEPSPSPSPSPPSEPEPDPDPPDGEPPEDPVDEITALEDEVTELTNAERADAGCEPVQTDERLRTAARGHSQDMAANDYFDHTGLDGRSPFDRMGDAGYPDPAGENIAYGYRTPADVMEGWMGSDGHRENLLTCSHRAIGVGLAYDPDGRPYWTQNFGR